MLLLEFSNDLIFNKAMILLALKVISLPFYTKKLAIFLQAVNL